MGGPKRVKPSPSRAQIEQALVGLGGGPAPVGPLAFKVCELMGVDTAGCGSYELRGLMSWSGLETELKRAVEDGALVARSRREWRDLTGGALFAKGGHGATLAYALPSVAAQWLAAAPAAGWDPSRARQEAARRRAECRVLAENRDAVERYTRELMEEAT